MSSAHFVVRADVGRLGLRSRALVRELIEDSFIDAEFVFSASVLSFGR